jgi:hypothetical protein
MLIGKFIPPSKYIDSVYSPESFVKTIDSPIVGKIIELQHFRVLGVVLNNNQSYNFAYVPDKLPEDFKETYPKEFLLVGDSIYKKAMSTEFFVTRNGIRRQYFLPDVKRLK